MKRTSEILAIINSLLIISTYVTPSLLEGTHFLIIFDFIKKIRIEIFVFLIIIILFHIKPKTPIHQLFKRYFYLLKFSNIISKSIVIVVITSVIVITFINSYNLTRARYYFYKNGLTTNITLKKELIDNAIYYENADKFDFAINKYNQYIEISGKDFNNNFLTEKIKTLENRIDYAQIFYNLSQKEYNIQDSTITMNGLSLSLIANTLFPTNPTISSFAKENAIRTIHRIDNFIDKIKNDSLNIRFNDDEITTLIGRELTNELSKGNYGKPVLNASDSIRRYVKKLDKEILKLYLFNSWKYYKLAELIDK